MPVPCRSSPSLSVIVPLFRSAETLGGCLRALAAQTERDFEVILIDSSPDDGCSKLVATLDLGDLVVRYTRTAGRMLPQEARNAGVALARGELLVFTDPDAYAAADWLARLRAAHDSTGKPISGGIACHGNRPVDRSLHLLKFSRWLPVGSRRPIDMGPTVNLLCSRDAFRQAGGFRGDMMMGDTTFGWELRRLGIGVVFEPEAAVAHDHLGIAGALLAERYRRGKRFGVLRARWEGWTATRCVLQAVASAVPIRLLTNLVHVAAAARQAGEVSAFVRGLPLLVVGFGASLWGEAVGCLAALRGPRAPRESAPQVQASPVAAGELPAPAARRA